MGIGGSSQGKGQGMFSGRGVAVVEVSVYVAPQPLGPELVEMGQDTA